MKKWIIGLAVVLLVLPLLVSCAGKAEVAPSVIPAPALMMPPAAFGGEVEAPAFKDSGEGMTIAVGEDRMIIRTGDMALVVEDVLVGRDKIALLATGFGGYVVSSQISGEEQDMRGWISIRVPEDKFEPALAEIRKLAVRVNSESTNSQDVTEEYVDLDARLKNAEATEKQYLDLLGKAETVEDILKVYDALARVRSEIEQLKGRLQYLERTAAMGLISVYLEPAVSGKPVVGGWSALEIFKSAIRGIVTLGQWLGTLAIWLLIFSPVWGTILGVVLWRLRRRKKV